MEMSRKPPLWVDKEYAGYGASWWDAVDQCRDVLVEWASHEDLGTYKQLSERVDAIPWPDGPHTHEGSQIGWLLGNVSAREWVEDRPLLSAVVVAADTRKPGRGFFDLAVELGELQRGASTDRKDDYWAAEVGRCFSHWSKKR